MMIYGKFLSQPKSRPLLTDRVQVFRLYHPLALNHMAFWEKTPNSAGGGQCYTANINDIGPPAIGEGTIVPTLHGWEDSKGTEITNVLPPIPDPVLRGIELPFANVSYLALSKDINRWLSNIRLGSLKARGQLQIPGATIVKAGHPIFRGLIKKGLLKVGKSKKIKKPSKFIFGKRLLDKAKEEPSRDADFIDVSSLSSHPTEAVKRMAGRLKRPNMGPLIVGLCAGSGTKNERINFGYCLLSDPMLLAMVPCNEEIKLSIVDAGQNSHFSDFMKLVVLWRCASELDRKAAMKLKSEGVAKWCRPLSRLANEASAALETSPSDRNDFRVNVGPDNYLILTAALDVLRLLPDTLVIWTSTHCDPAFEKYDKTTPSTYIPVVSDVPLVVDDAGTMNFQQIRLILATRSRVEFRGSKITGSFSDDLVPKLPSLVVQSYCFQRNKLVPKSGVYRDADGMVIHPPNVPRKYAKLVEEKLVAMSTLEPVKVGRGFDTKDVYTTLKYLCDYSSSDSIIKSSGS